MNCAIILTAFLCLLGYAAGQTTYYCEHDGSVVVDGNKFLYKECSRVVTCQNGQFVGANFYGCPANSHCENQVCVCDSTQFEPVFEGGILAHCAPMAKCEEHPYIIDHGRQFIFNGCSRVSICENGFFKDSQDFRCPIGTQCDPDGHSCIGATQCVEGRFIFQHGEVWIHNQCTKASTCDNGFFVNSRPYACPSGTVCDGENGCVAAEECKEGPFMFQHEDDFIFKGCSRAATCKNGYFVNSRDYSCPAGTVCTDGHSCSGAKGCQEGDHVFEHGHDFVFQKCSTVSTCNNGYFVNSRSFSCPEGTMCVGDNHCLAINLQIAHSEEPAADEPMLAALAPMRDSPPIPCPHGYHYFEEELTCIKAVSNERMTFKQARDYCQEDGGELVHIYDSGLNSFVAQFLTPRLRYWIGICADNGVFKYLTGVPVTDYLPWAYKEPNNHGGNEWCMEIIGNKKGSWNDKRCSRRRPFVCQKPANNAGECREGDYVFKHGEVWLYGHCSKATRCYNGFFTRSLDFSCPSNTVCREDKCLKI